MGSRIEYDYIIAGQGCAGLSLAVQLSLSGLPFENVLLIDKEQKNQNDRSWCFWTKESDSWYEPIVNKSWNKIRFTSPGFEQELEIKPFTYKFIRGLDFYTFCRNKLAEDPRFELIQAHVNEIRSEKEHAEIICSTGIYKSKYVFNSVFRQQRVKSHHLNYVQHFMGWLVETDQPCFDQDCPTFMDFNTEQDNDFRFFYVIPYSANKALVEYTGFSQHVLAEEVYERKLKSYMALRFPDSSYSILEKEKGVIPMAESPFVNPYGSRVINIGTAGGQNKISTGYAFYFIQKHCLALINQLRSGSDLSAGSVKSSRFKFYDKVLLKVLHSEKGDGFLVFQRLFEKNSPALLLEFLNEESDLSDELRIFLTVRTSVFLPAALKKTIS